MSRHALLLLLGLAGCNLAIATPGGGRSGTVVVRQPALPEPSYLPQPARVLLHQRMARHREDLALLSASALALEFPELEVAAGEIIGEPQLARPGPDERDTLNARLPSRFFDLQEELVARAKLLRTAARRRSGPEVASAYGQVAETCVACHAVYLDGK